MQEYSDTLLIFLLKGARPEKYRDRYEVKHAGQVGIYEVVIDGDGDTTSQAPDPPQGD